MIRLGNNIITTPILEILQRVQLETGYRYLQKINPSSNSIMITCPFHGDHNEAHPSCGICIDETSDKYGVYHCFACGSSGPLVNLIGKCFDQDGTYGENWLIENYGELSYEEELFLDDFELETTKEPKEIAYLDESILDNYNYWHPYMEKRGITPDIIRKFRIGYDKETDSITFPVWDWSGNLVSVSRRSVSGKNFHLEANQSKVVYLLNFIRQLNPPVVYVAESQINALTLWKWGYPAVALFGTGSSRQYDILKSTGIVSYVLCLDPDLAGRKGTIRFNNNIKNDTFISIKDLPEGKDVNDLTKEEFDNCETLEYDEWKIKYKKVLDNSK